MTRSSCARLVAVLCVVFAADAVTAATAAPVVILLSLDGVRHDYPDLRAYPGLARMQRDGVRAQRLVAGWPSSTFPGHVALATGVWADRHGILDNRFYDRALKKEVAYSPRADWIEAEPLWIAAERQGIRAATYFWVGSETDWHGQRSRYRIAPFDSAIGEARKVDQIIAWLDLPVGERPGLIMSYWHGTDDIGHEKGPTHPDIAVRLGEQDAQLMRLFAAIDARRAWPATTVIVVSDHGMTKIDEGFDLPGFLVARGIEGRVGGGGAVSHVFLRDPRRADDLVQALAGRGLPSGLHAWRRDQLPAAMHLNHPTRTGDVVVVADAPLALGVFPWWARIGYRAMGICCGWSRGSHGYDPNSRDMGGIFFAVGRGVPKAGRIGAVTQVDVAPTVARLLGIAPPRDSVGIAVPGITVPGIAVPGIAVPGIGAPGSAAPGNVGRGPAAVGAPGSNRIRGYNPMEGPVRAR